MGHQYNGLPWFIKDPLAAITAFLDPDIYVSLDFETTNKDYGSAVTKENRIILTCWEVVHRDGRIERKSVWGDQYDLAELEADIKRAQFIVAHNAKFELQWLSRCGLDLRDVLVFDTYLAEWVIAGNRGNTAGWELNLDDTAKRYGIEGKVEVAAAMISCGIATEDIPREHLLPYCHRDVLLTRELYVKQREVLRKSGLMHIALTRNLCCSVLADIEFNGAELDKELVTKEYADTINEFRACEAELASITGGINLSSPKQLAAYLFDVLKFPVPRDNKGNELKTAKGAYKTDAKTLDKLKPTTDEQRNFIKLYRRRNRLDSLISKNLEFFRLVCEQRGGKFYGNINQGFTQTHRLASTGKAILFEGQKTPRGAQFQNMPRQYKGLFTAHDEDYVCMEFDAAQLEFRVGTEMGNDAAGLDMLENGKDVHSDTAKVFVDWNQNNPTKQHDDFVGITSYAAGRQPAKAQTFKPMYGGMGSNDAEREYCKFFKQKYNGIATTQKNWCLEVLDAGKLRTPYGLIFYWPGTRMSRTGYIDNTTNISNYPIQGFATAEIIPIALAHFWHKTRHLRVEVFNTIHDSICARVHKDDVEEAKQIAKVCMTTDVYNFLRNVYKYDFKVPLGVGFKVAKNWGATNVEEIHDVWPDGRETYKVKN